ncbi:protein-L-isoaspartate O-methyltransferase [endosymbiont of Riftia pachyptila (vent Ph05)]|nr:protein-L-isoaspartate O-methyltransferase [endosymbiont of Riftia pachyptila (vent Ph05)]
MAPCNAIPSQLKANKHHGVINRHDHHAGKTSNSYSDPQPPAPAPRSLASSLPPHPSALPERGKIRRLVWQSQFNIRHKVLPMIESSIERARFNMIEQQIRPWEVLSPAALETLQTLPREAFAPAAYRGLAFADCEIPLGHGETMLFPRIEGKALQSLDIQPSDLVYEVGTGSGFLTACLAKLARQVVSIDIHPDFTEQAAARLDEMGIHNVSLSTGNALQTPSIKGPFDAILVSGSVPTSEQAEIFRSQLKPGGRLFIAVGEAPVMELLLITRESERAFREEAILETELKALQGAAPAKSFEF